MSTLDDLRKLRDNNEDGWTPEAFDAAPWPSLLDYTIALAEAAEGILTDGSDLQGLMDGGVALRAALGAEIPGLS